MRVCQGVCLDVSLDVSLGLWFKGRIKGVKYLFEFSTPCADALSLKMYCGQATPKLASRIEDAGCSDKGRQLPGLEGLAIDPSAVHLSTSASGARRNSLSESLDDFDPACCPD